MIKSGNLYRVLLLLLKLLEDMKRGKFFFCSRDFQIKTSEGMLQRIEGREGLKQFRILGSL